MITIVFKELFCEVAIVDGLVKGPVFSYIVIPDPIGNL